MPFNLLLLPLLGGYFFIHLTYRFRFRAYGLDNYRLIFESAAVGIGALIISYALTRIALAVDLLTKPILFWKAFAPFPYSGSTAGALILGLLSPLLLNRIWNRQASSRYAIHSSGNDLERMLQTAWEKREEGPVLITLASRKVYVAWITLSLNLKPSMPFVTILPTLSGYRDKDTLMVTYTTSYLPVYERLREENKSARAFELVIPTSSIVSASPFSDLPSEAFAMPAKISKPDRPAHAED